MWRFKTNRLWRGRVYHSRSYWLKKGEYGDKFFIVEKGKASAYKTLEPGKQAEKVLDYSPGNYFGELALIKGEPRAASVKAEVL